MWPFTKPKETTDLEAVRAMFIRLGIAFVEEHKREPYLVGLARDIMKDESGQWVVKRTKETRAPEYIQLTSKNTDGTIEFIFTVDGKHLDTMGWDEI